MASQVRWPIRLWRSDRRDLSCRPASSPQICTEKSIGTTNYSRQSSGIVLLRYSSVEICFLLRVSVIQFGHEDFVHDYLVPSFHKTRESLGTDYPDIFLILGNDDPRCEEGLLRREPMASGTTSTNRRFLLGDFAIYGLAYVPPTPFLLKDWERYDVSRYVPPGCVSPEEGSRTVPAEESEIKWSHDPERTRFPCGGRSSRSRSVLLHTPPCDTPLDRAALDGKDLRARSAGCARG